MDFDFSQYFPLLGESDLLAHGVFNLFTLLLECEYIPESSILSWVIPMMKSFSSRSATANFVRNLSISFMDGMIVNASVIPFFLLALSESESNLLFEHFMPFVTILGLSPKVFPFAERFLVAFLIRIFYNSDAELIQECMVLVLAQFVQQYPSDSLTALFTATLFFSASNFDLSSFLCRICFVSLDFVRHPIGIHRTEEGIAAICRTVFHFLFQIPSTDRYYSFGWLNVYTKPTHPTFRKLLDVFDMEGPFSVKYQFATRTTLDLEWVDIDLACHFVDVMKEHPL
jgi:hypothetical protein